MKNRMILCFLLTFILCSMCGCSNIESENNIMSPEKTKASAIMTAQPSQTAETVSQKSIKAVSLGGKHSAAITSDNQIFIWGDNEYGQLGDSTKDDKYAPVNITNKFDLKDGEYIAEISLGYYHSMALSSEGKVFTWGFNQNFELGIGQSADQSKPINITNLFDLTTDEVIVAISSGAHHSSVLTSEGSIYIWGDNSHGQLGDAGTTDRKNPTDITEQFDLEADEKAAILMSKVIHSTMITSKSRLYKWGANMIGQIGDGTIEVRNTPIDITSGLNLNPDESILTVSNSLLNSAAITSAGRVFIWGSKDDNALLSSVNSNTTTPIDVTSSFSLGENETIKSISLGEENSLALTSLGKLFSWGKKASNPVDITSKFHLNPNEEITSICTCNNHFSVITSDGRLFLWGENSDGQVGYGVSGSYVSEPVEISIDN